MSLTRPNVSTNLGSNLQGNMPISSGQVGTSMLNQQTGLPISTNLGTSQQGTFPIQTSTSMINQPKSQPLGTNLGMSQQGTMPITTSMINRPVMMPISSNIVTGSMGTNIPVTQQQVMPTSDKFLVAGNLVIRPLTARITRSTSFFGKMDPLVKVIIGSHFQKTPAARKGHKNPGWETELSMRRSMNEENIVFEIWDRDIASDNDFIAITELPFATLFSTGNRYNGWLRLRYRGKHAGELLVDVVFIPDNKETMPSTTTSAKSYTKRVESVPKMEIDESKVLESDPHKIVRRKSIGTSYSYPLQGETHTSYSPSSKFDKETMTTRRLFYQEPQVQVQVQPVNYTTVGTSMVDDSRRYSASSQQMPTVIRDYEYEGNPGDIITGYYDRDRMDRSNKVRALERPRSLERGNEFEEQSSSYYQTKPAVNRSIEKKNMNPGMEKHTIATADQAL